MAARTTAKAAAQQLDETKLRARAGRTEIDGKSLLRVLNAVQQGDFTARVPVDRKGSAAKIATALNSILESHQRLEGEVRRLSRDAGEDGQIKQAGIGDAEDLLKQSQSLAKELQSEQQELRRHRTQLERLVEERTVALTAINRELEAFSYSISHDLRGPLVAFDAMCKAMLENYGHTLDARAIANLERMREASARMTSVFDGLQMLFRLTGGEIRREELDISTMATTVAEAMRAADANSSTQVEVVPGIVASGDRRLVEILLANLINNAWKFSRTNPSPRIMVGQEIVGRESRIFVRDNGVGFDMIDTHRLFGAFQRLHSQSEFPGAGIGLAAARRIVNRHGGRIWAEGAAGEGATFYFVL